MQDDRERYAGPVTLTVARSAPYEARPPESGSSWTALCSGPLPVAEALEWVRGPAYGAVALFIGCVRDHSPGRADVVSLDYEAYEGPAINRMGEVVAGARRAWPSIGRVAIVHRLGLLRVTEDAVVVAVSSPHRSEAFEAARHCIDQVKATVPIWKHETWEGGEGEGTCALELEGGAS